MPIYSLEEIRSIVEIITNLSLTLVSRYILYSPIVTRVFMLVYYDCSLSRLVCGRYLNFQGRMLR